MSKEEQLKILEKMRAKGELTEGEFLGRKHKLMNAPEEGASPLNPVFTSSALGSSRKRGKLIPIIVILILAGAAYYWFFMR